MWPCEECRFDPSALDTTALHDAIAGIAKRYQAPLTRFLPNDDQDVVLRTRPAPDTWSALEYVVHVRAAVQFYDERIRRVVEEDQPRLTVYGFAEACDAERYNEEEPAAVLETLVAATTAAAARIAALTSEQWQRAGVGSDGDSRTVRVLVERLAHEGHHHLLDVGRSMRAARDAARNPSSP